MRISWPTLVVIGVPFAALAVHAMSTGEAIVLKSRVGYSRHVLKEDDPKLFGYLLVFYVVVAAIGWLFSFYRFRRGSWFNPI